MNVAVPTITPVLPAEGTGTGAGVIIAPGGGNYFLAIDTEGMDEARWFAKHGIAAFVLKYRTKQVDPDHLNEVMGPFLAAVAEPGSDTYKLSSYTDAVDDGRAAIKLVRDNAPKWGVRPDGLVFVGFSAGAFLALQVATAPDRVTRPDYLVVVYPSLDAIKVPNDAPPMFGAIALDDQIFKGRGFGLLSSWQASGRPFEFHLYEKGGHGFGMGVPGTTTNRWIEDLYAWFSMHHLLSKKP